MPDAKSSIDSKLLVRIGERKDSQGEKGMPVFRVISKIPRKKFQKESDERQRASSQLSH